MKPSAGRLRVPIVTLLALLLLALTTAPAAAGTQRYPKLEWFKVKLINCTRTGGKVLANGSCKGYGSGRYAKRRVPIKMHRGIADAVAYPWARKIAKANYCGHTLAGSSVDRRFSKANFKHRDNGENVGCSYAWTAKEMVIRTHRMMESEKAYNGWHWRQMRDPDFKSAGVGVVKVGGKTRVVTDYYGKRP